MNLRVYRKVGNFLTIRERISFPNNSFAVWRLCILNLVYFTTLSVSETAGWKEIRVPALHIVNPYKAVENFIQCVPLDVKFLRYTSPSNGAGHQLIKSTVSPRSKAHNRCIERSSANESDLRVVVWTSLIVESTSTCSPNCHTICLLLSFHTYIYGFCLHLPLLVQFFGGLAYSILLLTC